MKEENIKIEELNNMELIRLIFDEVKRNGQELDRINDELKVHREILNKHDASFERIEAKLEAHDERFEKIEQKIDANFKYLDEKIDNTKNQLVSEIAEELNNFSIVTTKLIKNLEKKIDNETNERKTEMSKVKGINEYDRIILNDIKSRISILEEESEKYNLN